MGVTRVEPSVVENVAISYVTHDRYGIVLENGEYPTVTASDWLEFRQDMESIIAIETVELERIRSNIAAIEEIHSLVRSMEESIVSSRSRNDDDFASISDDVESDMDFEYVPEHDDRDSSGFYSHKEDQISGIKSYVQSFYDATCVQVEDDFDGAIICVILFSDHFFAHGKGWDAINAISDRCEAEYEYKKMLQSMPEGMRNRMPTE
jgi:hypothetical protein